MKCFLRLSKRSLRISDLSAKSMLFTYKLTNHGSEYWYMGSIPAKSAMQKYSIEEYSATDVYSKRFSFIFFSVSSEPACFSLISLDKVFDELSAFTAVSSSRMFPLDVDRTSRILSSISFNWLKN